MVAEEKPKTPTKEAVSKAVAMLAGSDAIAFIVIALPEDEKAHEEAYIMGDTESLAPLVMRLQHVLFKMFDIQAVKPEEKPKVIEGYR